MELTVAMSRKEGGVSEGGMKLQEYSKPNQSMNYLREQEGRRREKRTTLH
jgi:hypothetical protein